MTGTFTRRGGAQPLTFRRSGPAAPSESRATQNPPTAPAAPSGSTGIQGTWLGTIHAPGGIALRIQLYAERDAGGALIVKMDSLDQNVNGIPVPKATLNDSAFHFEIP